MEYNFHAIEKKWQDIWDAEGTYYAVDGDTGKPKVYINIEFPYPSANGLHVGAPRSYTALDIVARKRRMQGYDVLFCMGWDAFGLPTENYAIKHNIHPKIVCQNNVDNFRRQLKMIGLSFDWSREINTTDPSYYKWTQWIFLQLYKKGLVYKHKMPINFCTSCKVGLANEEVVGGVCERCGAEVVRREIDQWMMRITDYAQRLLDGLDDVDYIERVKQAQRHWIGRSEGATIRFALKSEADAVEDDIVVFTTRPDTIYGATYMVLSPEHELVAKYAGSIANMDAVKAYQLAASRKSDFQRTELSKDKTGVKLEGLYAINPISGAKIPVYIADYVLTSYGTGAIMAVPAHDERDHEFALKYGCAIIEVVQSPVDVQIEPYTGDGAIVNSPLINGLSVPDAIQKIIGILEEKQLGSRKVNYKLRDWVFSRQRYWGEPIPIVHCDKCGYVPLPEEQLPLELPDLDRFVAGEDGKSPLANATEWVNTTCPTCGGPAQRETDTMPNWAGSSWYYLRYIDPHNDKAFADYDKMKKWLPLDWYNGGMEHATLHLLYSRFWHQALYDMGYVPTPEPYVKRTAHGMILGENGEKMSKSRGNVVNPDDVVKTYGADAYRTYMMFIGAYDQSTSWNENGLAGCYKFLQRVWDLFDLVKPGGDTNGDTHKLIKKVTEDIEVMKFNTAVAAMMSYINTVTKNGSLTRSEYEALLTMLHPYAPHMTEELWQRLGNKTQLSQQPWMAYDEAKTIDQVIDMPVQINGKMRGHVSVALTDTEDVVREKVLANEKIAVSIDGKQMIKFILVPGRIVNIVVK